MKNKVFSKKKLQIKSNWDKQLTLSSSDQKSLKGGLNIGIDTIKYCYKDTVRNCQDDTIRC